MKITKTSLTCSTALLGLVLVAATPASAHFIGVVGNNSIDGSLCVGFDCVAEEAFGFDTIRLKENNLRLDFEDTSVAASFPQNDWRIIINDSTNGGASHFSIEDRSAGNQVFRVFAGARNNALVVDSQGDLGLGTTTPALDIDIKTGDTPSLRLQQDGSSGFTPQSWDIAGNETSFFIRDATNGSTLPFRIEPGASSNVIYIEDTDDVGFGTTSPVQDVHVHDASGTNVQFKMTHSTSGTNDTSDGAQFAFVGSDVFFTNREDGDMFFFTNNAEKLKLDNGNEHTITGNLTVSGDIDSGGTTTVPDYVFEPDYPLMPLEDLAAFLAQEKHLPNVPSALEVKARGSVNMTKMQMALLEKIEELTLYTLQQHEVMAQQQEVISEQQEVISEIRRRLAQIESAND